MMKYRISYREKGTTKWDSMTINASSCKEAEDNFVKEIASKGEWEYVVAMNIPTVTTRK